MLMKFNDHFPTQAMAIIGGLIGGIAYFQSCLWNFSKDEEKYLMKNHEFLMGYEWDNNFSWPVR